MGHYCHWTNYICSQRDEESDREQARRESASRSFALHRPEKKASSSALVASKHLAKDDQLHEITQALVGLFHRTSDGVKVWAVKGDQLPSGGVGRSFSVRHPAARHALERHAPEVIP